jgi:hypothetical protein
MWKENPRNYLSILKKQIWSILVCLKKNVAWILQQVHKIQKDFDLYFKNIKNLFWQENILFIFNIRIKNLHKDNIIRDNNLSLLTFNIRIEKLI